MKFVDEAWIEVKGGQGGDGSCSFRREKFIPMGGPDGGDGGQGGSIWAEASHSINTLIDFRYAKKHFASHGEHGRGADQYGASGKDIVLRVPVGTLIFNQDTNHLIADMQMPGEKVLLAKGGAGGLGNLHFKSSTNRAPRQRTLGKEGDHLQLRLELKLLADIGLLGKPNAGKSTLVSVVSNAKPRIADYPFTTLYPQLGVVSIDDGKSFVIADIPGLIEGAAQGHGLGHQFLRHLQRTNLLLHLVDLTDLLEEQAMEQSIAVIENELSLYAKELLERPRWLVFNKMDVITEDSHQRKLQQLVKKYQKRFPVFTISAMSRQGTQALMYACYQALTSMKSSISE